MYNVTEIVAKFDKENHKVIRSILVDRKNHSFNNLKELAYFSREHYIFTSFQEQSKLLPRDSNSGKNLYLGNNLLWIDLDYEINLKHVREKMVEKNLMGFGYYTSKFYKEEKQHARLCIVLDKPLSITDFTQTKFFAQDVINLLNLKYRVDSKIYSFSSYLSKVKGNYKEKELFVLSGGKPYKIIPQKDVIEEFTKSDTRKKEHLVSTTGYEDLLPFLQLLSAFPEVDEVYARNNGTVNISFKDIPEKTKNGYYINPDDPWFINHPNKEKKLIYTNTFLKESFEKYKEFCIDNFQSSDIFKDYLKPDKSINTFFVQSKLFKIDESLIFIESPTGSGKTTAVSEFMRLNKDKSVLFISVNRMQAVATKASLAKHDLKFDCYLTSSTDEFNDENDYSMYNKKLLKSIRNNKCPNRLILGILSLYRLLKDDELIKTFDYIIIDEVTTIPNSTSNALELVLDKFKKYESSMKAFSLLLTNAEKVICMDGFISKPIIKCIEKISNKKAFVIQNTANIAKTIEIYCSKQTEPRLASDKKITCVKYFNHLYNDLINASYKNNNTVMIIALSNKSLSNILLNFIKQDENLKNKKVAIFNRDITKKDGASVIKMFENFKDSIKEASLDIVIYSPTITTGIDIPQAEGTNVYYIISGDYLSSHTNYQMTMRGRKAKTYKILIPRNMFMKNNKTTLDLKSRIQQLVKTHPTIEEHGKPAIVNIAIKKDCAYSGVVMCYLALESTNFSNSFFKDVKNTKRLGLLTALRIDHALVEFQNDLYKYGKSVPKQYLNFLKHEKCKISIEQDIEENYFYKYKTDKEKTLDKFKDINYKINPELSIPTLYEYYNKILFIQRILIGFKKENIPDVLKEIIETMETFFNQYKYSISKYKNSKYFNIPCKDLKEIYNYFFHAKTIDFFQNTAKEINKARLTLTFLRRMFKVVPVKIGHNKEYEYYTLTPKLEILESIENITESHEKLLFITNYL